MNSKILHAALFCPSPEGHWGLPILLWGDPGVGKTSFLADSAKRTGLAYKRISPAEQGECGFGVTPVPENDSGQYLNYPPPKWVKPFSATGSGLVFVDEISAAAPALQAPLLGVVQLRVLGDYQFPLRTRVVGAGNEAQDVGGWDLSPALANRFGHFDFDGLSANDWALGLLSGFAYMDGEGSSSLNAEDEEKRVMEAWPGAIADAYGVIAGFIQRRPELLHKRPGRGDAKGSKAWCSRRSWNYAATALASARVHGLSEIDADTFMAAFVGLPAVTELATWRANLDLPSAAAVLDGTVSWKHDPRRLDRTLAVLGSCAAMVVPEKAEKKKDRGNQCWKLIDAVLKDAADVAIPAARSLIQAKMHLANIYPAYKPVGDRLYPVLLQAGLAKPV